MSPKPREIPRPAGESGNSHEVESGEIRSSEL